MGKRLVDRLEIEAVGGHAEEYGRVIVANLVAAVRARQVGEVGGHPGRGRRVKGRELPCRPGGVEAEGRAVQRDRVCAEAVEDRRGRLRELLHDVVHEGRLGGEAEARYEAPVGERVDAARAHSAEVDGDAVRFFVAERSKDAGARGERGTRLRDHAMPARFSSSARWQAAK